MKLAAKSGALVQTKNGIIIAEKPVDKNLLKTEPIFALF
jgi:hypothetical protein